MNNKSIDSFVDFCDDIHIANEADLKYKMMRKVQTNTLALNNQLLMQKKECKKRYDEAIKSGKKESFITWLNKQKNAVNRKINGNEIKDKNTLKKFITLYDEYLRKIGDNDTNNYKNTIESFIDFCDDMYIAEESARSR